MIRGWVEGRFGRFWRFYACNGWRAPSKLPTRIEAAIEQPNCRPRERAGAGEERRALKKSVEEKSDSALAYHKSSQFPDDFQSEWNPILSDLEL